MIRSGLLLAALLLAPAATAAQDVEMLGERYGTPVPGAYYRIRDAAPDAFEFHRGRALRMRQRMEALQRAGGAQAGGRAGRVLPQRVLGPRDGPVEGTFEIPVVLGLFFDSPDTIRYGRDTVQAAYFSDHEGSITAFYSEASGGRVTLLGDVIGWVRGPASSTRTWVTNGNSGLSERTGKFIRDILSQIPDVDWGRYDNDGPDGIPNSGDDDGFVDTFALLHPTEGAECGNEGRDDKIWSHRWSLSAPGGSPYQTTTPAANGGFIKVDDYVVQPIFACNQVDLNEIGVFTHELGHAFGLPDLYDTYKGDGKHQGAGSWDLMATGSWGCDNNTPSSPCHPGAWSKAVLGWVDVVDVAPGSDLGVVTLPPVESSGVVYRVESADDSGEYFLLENRQRIGFDRWVPGEGLLVWQIDPDWVASYWPINEVNAHPHMGVWLRQADGLGQLQSGGGGRGDAGDPFPYVKGATENRVFHARSRPASTSFEGSATGVTLLDIDRVGDDVTFRLVNRYATIAIESDGAESGADLFTVNGAPMAGPVVQVRAAPFVEHEIEAAAGDVVQPGVRHPFQGWADDPAAERVRTVVTPVEDATFTARYGGTEVELAMDVTGGINGVEPGTFTTVPASDDLWFGVGTEVQIEAVPRTGFGFLGWSGALAGQPNPAVVTLDGPVQAGADFELTYAVASTSVSLPAATEQEIRLEVDNGNAPVFWSLVDGSLPDGMRFDILGAISGAALQTGTFTVTVEALDAIGLTARADLTLEVTDPVLSAAQLASPFLLTGPNLTLAETRFLDRAGNGDGGYDLGDLRAWILAHPDLPLTAAVRSLAGEPIRVRVGGAARPRPVRDPEVVR